MVGPNPHGVGRDDWAGLLTASRSSAGLIGPTSRLGFV